MRGACWRLESVKSSAQSSAGCGGCKRQCGACIRQRLRRLLLHLLRNHKTCQTKVRASFITRECIQRHCISVCFMCVGSATRALRMLQAWRSPRRACLARVDAEGVEGAGSGSAMFRRCQYERAGHSSSGRRVENHQRPLPAASRYHHPLHHRLKKLFRHCRRRFASCRSVESCPVIKAAHT